VYLTPLFAVGLSYLILKESFGWLFWLGGALVLAGVILADPPWRKRRNASPPGGRESPPALPPGPPSRRGGS
jgi:hypothetical protein